MRELGTLLSVMTIFLAAKISNPDDDKDKLAKNRYSYLVKLLHKISDEVAFYYNPLSFESITTGSVVPSLNLLVQAQKAISHTASLVYGEYKGDEDIIEKAHPTKYFLNIIPGANQFQNEILPLIDPELAKEMGVRMSPLARMR